MERKVTITQIAKEAGVSIATVSRVFNNKELHKVSPENRERLTRLMRKYHYMPNINALGLASHRSRMIGFLITSILGPIMNATVFENLTRCVYENNYSMIVGLSNWNPEEEKKTLSAMLKRGIDGLIWHPLKDSSITPEKRGLPVLSFSRDLGESSTPCVCTDEEAVGAMAAEYLFRRNLKTLYFIGCFADYHTPFRLEGWENTCQKYGCAMGKPQDVSYEISRLPETLLSKLSPENGYFCLNYRIALMLERAMAERGFRDCGNIVAYGDVTIADFFLRRLPLITPDSETIARTLFQTMLALIENNEVPRLQKIAPQLHLSEK